MERQSDDILSGTELKSGSPQEGDWMPTLQPRELECKFMTIADAQRQDAEAFFRSKLGDVHEPSSAFGLFDAHVDGSQMEEARQEIDAALAKRVRTHTWRFGRSAAGLFHAAWGLVVARTSGSDDVVFGTVLLADRQRNGRAQRELEMPVGTLPIRLRLHDVTAKELMEQTQLELVELLKYRQVPLTVAQQCSGITGHTPLFSTVLTYRLTRSDLEAEWAGAPGIRVLDMGEALTNYPIAIFVDEVGKGFRVTAQTDRRIDPHRITGYLHATVRSLVEALEQAPHTPALALSILPESERHEVIERFNATTAACPLDRVIHELFEEQVERTPEALAVVYEGQALTYAELNGRANQLARYLRHRGLGPDQLVGICIERSLEMVVGLLGILKAGGAYVPLDPDYPAERLAYMLSDSAPKVLLIQERLRERLPETTSEVIALDNNWTAIARQVSVNLDAKALGLVSDHLAYVIYTSGSTGQPKGVMIEHRHVVTLRNGLEHACYQSTECSRIALNASLNFDASVQQLVQLTMGRTIFVVPQEARRDASRMLKFIDENRIDGIDCTPSQLKSWVSSGLLKNRRSRLRTVLVGGEAIDPELWSSLAQCPETDFHNVYGPTECTVDATIAHLKYDTLGPHIGHPMENRRVYILDRHEQPVPIGVAGEIYVGGVGVGRGYLNRPELTAELFLPDPFSADLQARMYKTGDIGRWRPDGTIEYLGRNDHQVKIRGFRIELGEIEAHLLRQTQVKEAVVLAREDVPGEKRLVAYVVPHESGGAAPSVKALRAHLKAVLPEHAVPSAFVLLERFPQTPNGKLDRRAFPTPELGAYVTRPYEPPQGEMENIVAGIWQELLQRERVGRQDNFFELGGHSLLAMQVTVRIRSLLAIEIPVSAIFNSSTLMQLSAQVKSLRQTRSIDDTASGEGGVDELLKRIAAMPESTVQELLQDLTVGEGHHD